jgi:hypothetical protein
MAAQGRNARIRASGGQEKFFLVFGIAAQDTARVQQRVENHFAPARAYVPASAQGYYSTQSVSQWSVEACEQIVGSRSKKPLVVTPTSLVLVWIPGAGDQLLLRAFDFVVWPSPINAQGGDSVDAVVRACEVGQQGAQAWADRVNRSTKHPAQLPPQNYLLPQDRRLSDLLRAIRSGTAQAEAELDAIVQSRFVRDDFGRVHPRRGPRFHAHEDSGGRVFMRDPDKHGDVWRDAASPIRTLNQLYRFGWPLPERLHFDVQRRQQPFKKEPFECCVRGTVRVTGQYINVYANDFLRASAGVEVG